MRIPIDTLVNTAKLGASAKNEADVPVRVAVFVDSTATSFLIDAVRGAFVPQTTAALVRVERLGSDPVTVKPDTDIALVLSCGSAALRERVQEIVVAGAPVCVLAESSVEVPFIAEDTPMLGLIAATSKTYLLDTLARWILDRTEKDTAFAANFPFMRIAAANRIVSGVALGNMATGALFFIPGADFPVMTAAQVGMMLQLATVFGKPMKLERGYEAAAIVAAGFALRAGTRLLCRNAGHLSFAVKALVGGAGTYAMGRALCALYERDVDYSSVNEVVMGAVTRLRGMVAGERDPRDTPLAKA